MHPIENVSHYNNSGTDKNDLRILLITGGHGFDKENFYGMIFSLNLFNIDTITQPAANRLLLTDSIADYNVIVFYDMWQEISEQEKAGFIALTESGTGLVFLHHSLASYQLWDTFTEIRGGKYYERNYDYPPEKFSGYKHDIILNVKVLDPCHPVTIGMKDFEIHDEGYSNIGVLPGVNPLLVTEHPECSEIIAWTNHYNKSKIVYLLLGHDNNAWSNENFTKLITNSINWAGQSN